MSNRKTAVVSLVIYVAISAASSLSFSVSAYGAHQEITVSPDYLLAVAGNDYEFSLVYDVSDGDRTAKGIAVGIHYDSSILHFEGFGDIFETEFMGDIGPADDEDDYDNDVTTDKYVAVVWWNPEGNWPNDALPLEVAKMKFLSLITGPAVLRTTIFCGDPAFTNAEGEANLDCADDVVEVVSEILEAVGGITDRLGNRLADVTIKTDWAGAETVSSITGYFMLSIPAGTHTVEVSKAGYVAAYVTIDGCDGCYRSIGDIVLETIGDVNADAKCDLADAIISIRILAGEDTSGLIRSDYVASGVDVDGDNSLGLSDLTYMLQSTTGIR